MAFSLPTRRIVELQDQVNDDREIERTVPSTYLQQFRQFSPNPVTPEMAQQETARRQFQQIFGDSQGFAQAINAQDLESSVGGGPLARQADPNEFRINAIQNDLRVNPPESFDPGDRFRGPGARNEEDPRLTELRRLKGESFGVEVSTFVQGVNFRPLLDGIRDSRGQAIDLFNTARHRVSGFDQNDINQILTNPNPLDEHTRQSVEDSREALLGAADAARASVFLGTGLDPQALQTAPFAALSGRDALELFVRSNTFNEVGLADIGLGEDVSPHVFNLVLEALAPVNFLIAGQGAGVSAGLRELARQQTGWSARTLLNTLAGAIEPFAGKGASAFAREVAADVGAQEAFRRTEGAPLPARLAAGAVAGSVFGFSPEIARGIEQVTFSTLADPERLIRDVRRLNASLDAANINLADPTIRTRAAGELERVDVLPGARREAQVGELALFGADAVPAPSLGTVVDPASGRLRAVPVAGGGSDGRLFHVVDADGNPLSSIGQPADATHPPMTVVGEADALEAAKRHPFTARIEPVMVQARIDTPTPEMTDSIARARAATAEARESIDKEVFDLADSTLPADDLAAARNRLTEAFDTEAELRRAGIPESEVSAGRARQRQSIQSTFEAATEQGLTSEEAIRAASSGAAVPRMRQTFAEPVPLTDSQRTAIFDEFQRKFSAGEMTEHQLSQAKRAVDNLISGEGLTNSDLRLAPLRELIGAGVPETVTRPSRTNIPRAPLTRARIPGSTGPPLPPTRPGLPSVPQRGRPPPDRVLDPFRNLPPSKPPARPVDVRPPARGPSPEIPGSASTRPVASEFEPPTPGRGPKEAPIDLEAREKQLLAIRKRELQAAAVEQRALDLTDEVDAAIARDRALNPQNPAEARAYREQAELEEVMAEIVPSSTELRAQVDEIMNRPLPQTPEGEVPTGRFGTQPARDAATGEVVPALTPPHPNVPTDLQGEVRDMMEAWYGISDRILDSTSLRGKVVLRNIQATLSGQIQSPFLSEAIYQGQNLKAALMNSGVEERVAKEIADLAMDSHLARRYDIDFLRLRRERDSLRKQIVDAQRLNREQISDPQALELLVDAALLKKFDATMGREAILQERNVNAAMQLVHQQENFTGVRKKIQEIKNTMFAFDASIFGIQGVTAVHRGGIPLLVGGINRLLAAMHVADARKMYSEVFASKQVLYGMDGLDQTARSSAFRKGEGSMLDWIPGSERNIPGLSDSAASYYIRTADRLNDIQFGTIMTGVRNWAYEGDLISLHLIHEFADLLGVNAKNFDVGDPLVRARAARHANTIGSSSRAAQKTARAEFEGMVTNSARMTRARMNYIVELARIFNFGDRGQMTLAAMSILSSVGSTMFAAQYLNGLFGVDEMEWNPALGGFGLMTLANGRVVDTIPQDSVTRAFAQSLKVIKDGDPEEMAEIWGKVALGSSNVVARIPPAAFNTGFEPGRGFAFGDLSTKGKIASIAPLPPVVASVIFEGFDRMGIALDTVGVASFEEGAFSETQRKREEAGVDTEGLSERQQKAAHAEVSGIEEVERLEARRVAEIREGAARGIDLDKALLVNIDLRDDLDSLYGQALENDWSKAEYRLARKTHVTRAQGEQEAYDHVWRKLAESENESERLAGERYALWDQIDPLSEDRYTELEELQGAFDAQLTPGQRDAMMAVINQVDVLANPWEQEYDILLQEVGAAGWWDIRNDAWTSSPASQMAEQLSGQSFTNERDYKRWWTNRMSNDLQAQGVTPGRADEEAREAYAQTPVRSIIEAQIQALRKAWLFEPGDASHAALADQMLEWGVWRNAFEGAEDIVDTFLLGVK